MLTADGDADGEVDGGKGLAFTRQRAGHHDEAAVVHHGAQASEGVVQQTALDQPELLMDLGRLVVGDQKAACLQVLEIEMDEIVRGRMQRGLRAARLGGRGRVARAVDWRSGCRCSRWRRGPGRDAGRARGRHAGGRRRGGRALLVASLVALPAQGVGLGDVGPDAGGHGLLGCGRGADQRLRVVGGQRVGREDRVRGRRAHGGGLVAELLHRPLDKALVHDITCWAEDWTVGNGVSGMRLPSMT